MRNLINYYYNLEPNDIHQSNDYYTFDINEYSYRLQEIDNIDIDKVYKMMLNLYHMGIYINQIIPTITRELSIAFNSKRYVLIKYKGNMNEKITLNDIKNFSYYVDSSVNDWAKLWSDKIDYYEYKMSEVGIKYPVLRESFAYYVGLAEVGIALFNAYKKEYISVLSHKRLKVNSTKYDLYDPLNINFDIKSRDIAEYSKDYYINNGSISTDIKEYVKNLNDIEKTMFFIRMFFPSFYFDMFEDILDGKKEESEIDIIIKKSNSYELLLKDFYLTLNKDISLPYISWLK